MQAVAGSLDGSPLKRAKAGAGSGAGPPWEHLAEQVCKTLCPMKSAVCAQTATYACNVRHTCLRMVACIHVSECRYAEDSFCQWPLCHSGE